MTTHPASVALPDPQRATPLECPRCGYDQSAIPPTWTRQCPVEGQCSECGLVFPWRDIFDPMRGIPRWSFEHVPRKKKRTLFLAAFRTLLRSLLPWKFWRTVELRWPVRPPRLVVYTILTACLVLYFGQLTFEAVSSLWRYHTHNGHHYVPANPMAFTYGPYTYPEWWLRQFGEWPDDPITSVQFTRALHYTATLPLHYIPVVHNYGLASSFLSSGSGRLFVYPIVSMSGWTIILAILTAIGYFLPVQTLSHAKITRGHQFRAAFYITIAICATSIIASLIGLLLEFIGEHLRYWYASFTGQAPWTLPEFTVDACRGILWLFVPALLFVHWWCAGRWYFRIETPALVSATITGIATVITLAITIVLLGDWAAFPFIAP